MTGSQGQDTSEVTEFEALARSIVEERLYYYGYDDEWIRQHENPPDHAALGCEYVGGVGWQCSDDEGISFHPDHDSYAETAEEVCWTLESTALAQHVERALAAERERVLQEAADEVHIESHHFPCCEHCGVKQRGYGHAAPCADCQTEAAAIARGNPHTEESP